MILVDTSVWVNHFRSADAALTQMLDDGVAATHPFVLGELAAANLKSRTATLGYFQALPQASIASEAEVHHFLRAHRLWGLGLGWVDLHLLASATMSRWKLFTADRAMKNAAMKLKLSLTP
jgi:predicted nucleic acid-binding protein